EHRVVDVLPARRDVPRPPPHLPPDHPDAEPDEQEAGDEGHQEAEQPESPGVHDLPCEPLLHTGGIPCAGQGEVTPPPTVPPPRPTVAWSTVRSRSGLPGRRSWPCWPSSPACACATAGSTGGARRSPARAPRPPPAGRSRPSPRGGRVRRGRDGEGRPGRPAGSVHPPRERSFSLRVGRSFFRHITGRKAPSAVMVWVASEG